MRFLTVKTLNEETNGFGKEVQFQFLKFEKKSFFQFSFSWSDSPNPLYLVLSGHSPCSLAFTLLLHKFGIEADLWGTNWGFYETGDEEDNSQTGTVGAKGETQ